MTRTPFAHRPRLDAFLTGDFDAIFARRSDTVRAFLAGVDLALMLPSRSILVVVSIIRVSLEQFFHGVWSSSADRRFVMALTSLCESSVVKALLASVVNTCPQSDRVHEHLKAISSSPADWPNSHRIFASELDFLRFMADHKAFTLP